MFTCSRSCELLDAEAGVERLEGERAAARVAEQDEPADADAVRGQEVRPPAPQERAVAVAADLHSPHLSERAEQEGRRPRRSSASASAVVEAPGELVGNALHWESVSLVGRQ